MGKIRETHDAIVFRGNGTCYWAKVPGPPPRPTHEWDPETETFVEISYPTTDPAAAGGVHPLH